MATGCRRKQSVCRAAADLADTRTAIVLVDKITEVGAQHPIAYRLFVQHVEIALLIDIRQLRMPHADLRTLLIEAIFRTGIIESVRGHPRRSPGREILHIRRVAQAYSPVLPSLQPQAFNLFGHQHGPAEGLGQQATIVIAQHRNIRQQLANFQLGCRKAGLGRQPRTTKIVGCAPITVHRQ